ncbi:MAG TPA: SIS domain-containing protein [Bacteroidales bacterium]|nr:SIS domain-containing protein [Bacteroidales bacterium]
MQALLESEFIESQRILQDFIQQKHIFATLESVVHCMLKSIQQGNTIITCGNGGSMTDAMHLAEELSGKFRKPRKALPAVAISDPSFMSCVANDYGYEYVFARFIESMGKPGDVLVAFTTSGNSKNIVLALQQAKQQNMKTIVLTGNTGGQAKHHADYTICVPHVGYADRIQEIHIKIIHTLIHAIEQNLL